MTLSKQSKRPMRLCAAGVSSLAILALLLPSSNVDAFAPRPSISPAARATKMAPRPDPFSFQSAQWAQLHDAESELVDDDVPWDSLNPMQTEDDEKPVVTKKYYNPTPVLFKTVQEMTQKNSGFAAVAALALGLFLTPLPSFAAMSGGRMGGSYSSPSRSSYSSGSVVPRSSYGGSSYSRGFSSGYGAGYYSRPSVMVNPFPVSPFYSPFGYGGYGYGSPGVVVSSGPSFFSLLLLGGFALAAFSAMSNTMSSVASSWSDTSPSVLGGAQSSVLGPGTSVVQVTVGLEVPNRDDPNSILSALRRLANTARTDSRVGIQNLTSQVALELLRRKNSIVSGYTKYKHFGDRSRALRDFNSRSIKERSKFESETVSNFGGVDYGRGGNGGEPGSGKATMAVVTLLLSIDGDSTKVPQIKSPGDVEDALRKIASDSKVDTCLQSAEILWTPEDRSETLTQREVLADYPELRSL